MTGYEASLAVMEEVKKVIIGKDDVVEKIMTAIISDGNILIDDIPGVGKTSMALAFSKAMSLDYNRVQFTPDVLPSDITGFTMLNKKTGEFEYKPGAVICNLFLADEINRTSSKTQSALLEAMEEQTVTVDSVTYELPEPFNVIATQNPVGSIGTHMLPESQLDRFMFCVSIGYPDLQAEARLLKEKYTKNPLDTVKPIIDTKGLSVIKEQVKKVFVHDDIYMYIAKIAECSRNIQDIELGISPRGSVAILRASQGQAYLRGRNYVTPEDVNDILLPVIRHRVIIGQRSRDNGLTSEIVVKMLIKGAAEKR